MGNRSGGAVCTDRYLITACQQVSTVPGINCVGPLETRMCRTAPLQLSPRSNWCYQLQKSKSDFIFCLSIFSEWASFVSAIILLSIYCWTCLFSIFVNHFTGTWSSYYANCSFQTIIHNFFHMLWVCGLYKNAANLYGLINQRFAIVKTGTYLSAAVKKTNGDLPSTHR